MLPVKEAEMKKFLMAAVAALSLFGSEFAVAQTGEVTASTVYGEEAGASALAMKNSEEVAALKAQAAEWKKAAEDLRVTVTSLQQSNASLLRQVAEIRKWERTLPDGVKTQIKTMVDEVVTAAIAAKAEEFTNALAELARTLDDRIKALEGRVTTLEGQMATVQADVVQLKKQVGINFAPELAVVGNHKTVAFEAGFRLVIPTKDPKWSVNLEGLVGITPWQELAWGIGIDVTKEIKPWLSLGPSLIFDAMDNPNQPGLTDYSVTAGVRADFHVHRHVDVFLGGGIGMGMESTGDPSFGWNFRAGLSFPCF